MVKLNFASNVKERKQVLPGKYPAVVSRSEYGISKNGGPKWHLAVRISGGDCEGETLHYETSLAPEAQWKVQQILPALGEDPEVVKSDDYDFEAEKWMGKEVGIVVALEKDAVYGTRAKIRSFVPIEAL